MKSRYIKRIILISLVLCYSTTSWSDSSKNLWKGEMTGMAECKLELDITEIDESNGLQKVEGKLVIDVISAVGSGGGLRLNCMLKGRVKAGLMEAGFSTYVQETIVKGKFIGTMSETRGFGTWTVDVYDEDGGRYAGEWTLEKI